MVSVYGWFAWLAVLQGLDSMRDGGSWAAWKALPWQGLEHIHGTLRGAWFWFTVMVTKPIHLFVIEAAQGAEGEVQRLSVSAGQMWLCQDRVPRALLPLKQVKAQVLLPAWPVFHKGVFVFFFSFFWYDNQCKELVSSEDFSFKRTKGLCRFGRFPSNKWHLWRHLEMPLIS